MFTQLVEKLCHDSVVEKAEDVYDQWIFFFPFKVTDVKSPAGIRLINFTGLYPK